MDSKFKVGYRRMTGCAIGSHREYDRGFRNGQQSKQAEIDELQKRIDTALCHLEDHEGYDDLTHVIKILRGELK